MRFIVMAAVLGATLAVTASAALAEGSVDSFHVQALTRANQASRTLSAADTSDRSNCPHLNCREGGHKL